VKGSQNLTYVYAYLPMNSRYINCEFRQWWCCN